MLRLVLYETAYAPSGDVSKQNSGKKNKFVWIALGLAVTIYYYVRHTRTTSIHKLLLFFSFFNCRLQFVFEFINVEMKNWQTLNSNSLQNYRHLY